MSVETLDLEDSPFYKPVCRNCSEAEYWYVGVDSNDHLGVYSKFRCPNCDHRVHV